MHKKQKQQKGEQRPMLPRQKTHNEARFKQRIKNSMMGRNPKPTEVSKDGKKMEGKKVKKMSKEAVAARKRTTLSNAAETMFRRQRSD